MYANIMKLEKHDSADVLRTQERTRGESVRFSGKKTNKEKQKSLEDDQERIRSENEAKKLLKEFE